MLNAAAASAYGYRKVEPDGGGTRCFQKSGEPFQSGTRPVTRTNLVLIRLKGSEYREGQMSLSPPDWMTGEEEIYRDLNGGGGELTCLSATASIPLNSYTRLELFEEVQGESYDVAAPSSRSIGSRFRHTLHVLVCDKCASSAQSNKCSHTTRLCRDVGLEVRWKEFLSPNPKTCRRPAYGESLQVLPDMQRAVEEGEASKVDYAYLYDRVMFDQGKPQHWGTQADCKNGKAVLAPVDDPAGLDQRRKNLQLMPVAIDEYVKLLDAQCSNYVKDTPPKQ